MTLYDEQLRVPLIIHLPDKVARKIEKTANQIDVLPTVLSLLDIPIPANIDGMDLLNPSSPAREYTFAELSRYQYNLSSVQSDSEKYIEGILKNVQGFDHLWFQKRAAIEVKENALQLAIQSVAKERTVQVFSNGQQIRELTITPKKEVFSIKRDKRPFIAKFGIDTRTHIPCFYHYLTLS